MLTRRGPPAMAIPFLVFGAFFAGYQLLRIGDINFTIADLMFALAFAICLARGQLTAIPFGQITPLWYFGLAMMIGGMFIGRSEEHTHEFTSLMSHSYDVFGF